jgi:hypothetical protein
MSNAAGKSRGLKRHDGFVVVVSEATELLDRVHGRFIGGAPLELLAKGVPQRVHDVTLLKFPQAQRLQNGSDATADKGAPAAFQRPAPQTLYLNELGW